MEALVTALLLPQGLHSMEDLEKDTSSISLKLEKARSAEHVLLIPQLLGKLEKRQDLKRKIDDNVAELLGPWGFDSINSLKNAIIETTDDLERAIEKGYSEIVAEEIEKLATMEQLLSDVLITPRNVQPAFLLVSSQNEIAGAEVLPSLPSVFPVEQTDSSRPSPPPAPEPTTSGATEPNGITQMSVKSDQLNHLLNLSFPVMPECAEKNLTLLYEYFKSERLRLASVGLQQVVEPPAISHAYLRVHLDRLLCQLSIENSQSNQVDTEMKDFVNLFSKYVTLTDPLCGELSDLVENMELALFRALKNIAPLDVNHLLNSVRGSLDTANFIKNKDIILLLGSTGAGKSTLMHFLAGSKMRTTEVSGIEHLEPDVVMCGLEDVTYSCSSRSETSGIHAVTIQLEDKAYIVCDTAGLGDLGGPEQDITSGVVMTRAIRSARSVKIVLLITQGALSDRYSNLRKTVVPSITRLIPTIADNVESIFYLFNMISDRLEGVAARLRDFSSHLEAAEKADISFTAMIRDLARKTHSQKHCTVADMTGGSNVALLKGFDSLEEIRNPNDVFHDFVAPSSINILRDQLSLHKASFLKGLNRFATAEDRGDLSLVDFKFYQLLQLHVTIGLPECSNVYFECFREFSAIVKNLYITTCDHIEHFFDETFTLDIDNDLEQCMGMVSALCELEDISGRHTQPADSNKKAEDTKGVNLKEEITGLLKRLMKESRDKIFKFITIVQSDDYMGLTLESDLDSLLTLGQSAALRFQKMLSLAKMPDRAGNQTVTVLAEISLEAMQLLDGQASELCNFTLGIVESVRSNLALKTYSNCLIPFMQLKALERFDMTPDMNMDEVISRSHRSFLDCITSDCENARQQVEDDIPGCADNFSTALQRTLKVTSIPAFSILLNLERLNLAVDSLARQAVLFCDSVRSNFQVTSSRRDGKLLNELKIGVASLDLLRIDAVIARATAESYHSLIASVKATVVLCFKQASKLVSAISVGHKTISNTATSGWFHLEGLILNIYEASTFRGGLKDAYNGEFDDLIAEISVVTQALTDHYLGGEDGVAISYRNHDNLKSLYSKKCSVMQLGEVVDGDCVKRVPELRKLSCEIMDSVAFCDSAVAAAATQGMTRLRDLLPTSPSDIPSTGPDDTLKYDVRDVLTFVSTAKRLGFISILDNTLETGIGCIADHFISVGNVLGLRLNRAYVSHQRSVNQTNANDGAEFDNDNALEMRACLAYLKSLECLLSPCGGYIVDNVKKSIQDAISVAIADLFRFLTTLNNCAENPGALSKCDHSALAVLTVDLQLCDLLSVMDEYLPSVDGGLNFVATAYQLKSAISKVISSTRNKIPLGDFDGVLLDLKEFKKENPMVATEMRGIVQEVLKALSIMLQRTLKTAENYQLGVTSEEATLTLFDDVREISNKSMLFIAYLTDDQHVEFAKRKEFKQGLNTIMHLICEKFRSRLDNMNVEADLINYYEAESLLAAASRSHPQLELLARDVETSQPKYENEESALAAPTYLTLVEQASLILRSKRCLIDSTISRVSSRYGKPLDLTQIRAMAPCKVFDDLKRAEVFDTRYRAVTTSLSDYLVEDVRSTLQSVHSYIESNVPSVGTGPVENSTVQMKVLSADRTAPTNLNGGRGQSPGLSTDLNKFQIESIEDCEDLVRNIEMFTPYFSLEVFERYQSELATTKQTVEEASRAHKRRIKEATSADANECHQSLPIFNEYVKANDFLHIKMLGDRMNKQFESLVQNARIDLGVKTLSVVFAALTPSYQDWMKYTGVLAHWNKYRLHHSSYLEQWSGRFFSWTPYTKVTFDVKPTLESRSELHKAILESVNKAIIRIMGANSSNLVELEPLFDGLFAFLHPSEDTIWDLIFRLDDTLRSRASNAIVAIGQLFALIGSQISKFSENVKNIMANVACESVGRTPALCDNLTTVSKVVDVAKNCAEFCAKVKELRVSSKDPCYDQLRTLEILSFDEMNARLNITIEQIQKVARPSLLDNQLLITPNASDRNAFYRKVHMALTLLIRWDRDQAITNGCVNNHANEESCLDKISSEIELIGAAADRLVGSTEYERLGMLYDNLRSISENLSDSALRDRSIGRMKSIDGLFYQRIEVMKNKGWLNEAEWNSQPFEDSMYEKVANELINMKTATTHISHCKKHIDEEYIDKLLKDYKSRPTGAAGTSFFRGLSIYLSGIRTSDAPIVSQILADHEAFTGHKLLIRNERILRFTVEDTMHDITGDDEITCGQQLDQATKNRLVQISGLFEVEYWSLVEVGLEGSKFPHAELESIVEKTEAIVDDESLPLKHKIRSLMAHVFAFWTLSESSHYQEAKAQGEILDAKPSAVKGNKLLLQPHSGQIVGILRLLGLDEEDTVDLLQGALECNSGIPSTDEMAVDRVVKEGPGNDLSIKIKNHVVQIGTGEGKSVTVAVSAILLALLGFEVDVACYSNYLTVRDFKSFKNLFDAFRVSDLIFYGTFGRITEKFINKRCNIREGIKTMIFGDGNATNRIADRCSVAPRILLVDEVDVFFDKKIYKSCYRCGLTIYRPEITAFIKELWAFRKRDKNLVLTEASVKEWSVYKACRDVLKGWEFILDESLPSLIDGLTYVNSPFFKYHLDVAGSRIGVKEFDGISYSKVCYWLLFAYFKEHQNGHITTSSLEAKICLQATCGNFSYAALPKMYDSILGVSGTLQELNASQKKLLREEYSVKNATHLPSVYGSNKLKFDANASCAIKITNIVEYYKEIVNEISLQIRGKFKDRAVFVFFETTVAMDDFLASSAMTELRGQVRVIREEDTAACRELTVRQAVTSRSITLMNRDFGRGTDFICFDDELDASGGVHVIQTFVSLDVSEEKQIKGRTARQGNQGSYSLVLLDTELEAIGISIAMIRKFEASGQRYTEIDQLRRNACKATFERNLAKLRSLEQKHEESIALLGALHKNDAPAVKELLRSMN